MRQSKLKNSIYLMHSTNIPLGSKAKIGMRHVKPLPPDPP